MTRCTSFPPISTSHARILILGSMPGTKSLEDQQYYAHPQNAFWPIMSALFDAPIATYAQRIALIKKNHLALWDVLKHCERPGSLDSAIRNAAANDFVAFFRAHPKITHVFLNGGKAATEWRRVCRTLPAAVQQRLLVTTLPSTSPAHAARSRTQKLQAWRVIKAV